MTGVQTCALPILVGKAIEDGRKYKKLCEKLGGVMPVRLFLCARFGFWFLQKIELGGLPGCLGSVFDGTVVRLVK